ncbi:MAG: RNA 2',3'-cyclic phosphodiesterase [Proteobacteria bacterium]|nr:MAG: RNA 2',3'-cyclic phosphodiesterase [Pseudomonadota bacterium]
MGDLPTRTRRLFFALWPAPALRRAIEHDTRALARRSGGRIVPARNFHVTLAFLGSVAESRLADLVRAGGAARAPRFELSLDRVQTLPRANVLCLAPSVTPIELRRLVDALRVALEAEGFELERRPFRPHLTLVRRLNRPMPTLPLPPVVWPVEEFVLVESRTAAAGSEYEVLARWPLWTQDAL